MNQQQAAGPSPTGAPSSVPAPALTPAVPAPSRADKITLAAGLTKIRWLPPRWFAILMGCVSIVLILALWWFVTRGESAEERIVSPVTLGSPAEVFGSFGTLWYDRALTRSLMWSLGRVVTGFLIAASIGVPLGVICGAYPWLNSFFAPVAVFGRNIPIAALIPLTLCWFGSGELQKIMFIFIACVCFVLFDTAAAVVRVEDRFLDTAYTLGASRWQVIRKVMVPLALPRIFDSLRLLFGLAFGYIMLAELIDAKYGLGYIIAISERRGPREHIILVLFIITIVAFLIDRMLLWVKSWLFPYCEGD